MEGGGRVAWPGKGVAEGDTSAETLYEDAPHRLSGHVSDALGPVLRAFHLASPPLPSLPPPSPLPPPPVTEALSSVSSVLRPTVICNLEMRLRSDPEGHRHRETV